MTKFFENISVNQKDITDLKELIPLSIYQDEDLMKFINLRKVVNGDPVAFYGGLEDVGVAGAGCDPTYSEVGVISSQKRWELGDWQIPIKICYESLQGTIAEHTLKTGTDVADLTTTEFMSYIIRPALEQQMKRMLWRFAWFGDKDAKLVSAGGQLKEGSKTEMFTTCDGLFKRIFKRCTTNSEQLTSIDANTKSTFKEQKKAILAKGVATDILDNMLIDADSRITNDSNAVILMTKGLADALTMDMKKSYSTIMPWETLFDGLDIAKYNGVTIARVGAWDNMIRAYENTGTKLNKPYRAVMANMNQLQVGTNANGLLSDLDIWFDKKERRNYIYSAGKIGTQILEDDMFHAAY